MFLLLEQKDEIPGHSALGTPFSAPTRSGGYHLSDTNSMVASTYVICFSPTSHETNTSAFVYVLSVMKQNSSTRGAHISSYFLQMN